MSQRIAIIDYGMGNLHSVAKAVEHVAARGDQVLVTNDIQFIYNADRIVFPGQGAARDCMAAINLQVRDAVIQAIAIKPFLGICMGMQVLMEFSEENGGTALLGQIAGQVRYFGQLQTSTGQRLKIPHMGWNQVHQVHSHPLWNGIPNLTRFYFVHSYHVVPQDTSLIAGTTEYGINFTSVLAVNNVFAVQFHPEKSADFGLKLLKNFLEWQPGTGSLQFLPQPIAYTTILKITNKQ
jgi:glutamine amidotransferase